MLLATIASFVENPLASKPDTVYSMMWSGVLSPRAKIQASKEPLGIFNDNKRPDGVTLVPWQRGKCVAWDVTVADTFASSYIDSTAISAGAAAETRRNPENKQIPAFTKQLHIRATRMRGCGLMEHWQRWIPWQLIGKNHLGNWWHKWKISPVPENINCSTEGQCSMCSMLFL